MTDETKEVDNGHVPVARIVSNLGLGWTFEEWKAQGEEWKNDPPFQARHGYDHMLEKHKDKKFICIRTGCRNKISQKKDAQKLQKKALNSIDIPILWEVHNLAVDIFFFEYELKENKDSSEK